MPAYIIAGTNEGLVGNTDEGTKLFLLLSVAPRDTFVLTRNTSQDSVNSLCVFWVQREVVLF